MSIRPVADDLGVAPTAVIVDGNTVRWLVGCLDQYLSLEREARRNPSLGWTEAAAAIVRTLHEVAANVRVSADGHRREPARRETSANGHAAPAITTAAATMVDVQEVAAILKISERQARRVAAQRGVKRGGCWVVSRAALEEASAS